MPNVEIKLGARVAEFRLGRALTQAQLAEMTGVSVETISRLERGVTMPSLKTIGIIAHALSTPLKNFFDFDPISGKSEAFEQELIRLNGILRTLSLKKLVLIHRILKVSVQ